MKSLKKFLYFAYGTNVNKKFFLKKFKNAKYLKKYYLNNFDVVFRSKYGVPDIQRKKGYKVNGVIYQIDNLIENLVSDIVSSASNLILNPMINDN